MEDAFRQMVDDLMPLEIVCIKNSATALGCAGK